MEYKISVIVPVYKVENYIERCAKSLFEQTMKEGVEYIFINDCTPDRSMQILEEAASNYPDRQQQIRYVYQPSHSGVSSARNTGLAIAQGEYIFYADADDWADSNMLAEMYKAAKENDADIVRSDFICSYSTHEENVKQGKETEPLKCLKLLMSEKLHGSLWTKLVRRSLYTDNKIVFYDGNWGDLRASVQLFYYAKKITCIPKAYYHYVQYNPSALSVKNLDERLNEMVRQTDGIIEFLKDCNVQLDKYVNYLKLAAKQTLLFTCDKRTFLKWVQVYPESNRYIWTYPSLPFHLRIVGGCTALKLWPLVDMWIRVKTWAKKIRNEKIHKNQMKTIHEVAEHVPQVAHDGDFLRRMMAYKISVIVPVYNVEHYIERCVRCLFEQTMKEGVEYIFVNDCTPDRSMQLIKEVASEYPDRMKHIRYVNHPLNKGASAARNTGLAMAQGEYIFYADGDDWTEKDMLVDLYRVSVEHDADIVRCDFFCTYSTYEKKVKQVAEIDPKTCMKLLLSEQLHGALWTKLVRRTLYTDNEIVFFDGYWEDLRASVQLFYYAKKTAYIPNAYYHYVQYNTSAQGMWNFWGKLDEILRNADGIIAFLKDKHVQLDKSVHYLKLAAKQTLLFTGDKSAFRKWLQIYPESNRYIWSYPSLPFHLRIIGGCTALRIWPLIDLWIQVKKWRNRKTN